MSTSGLITADPRPPSLDLAGTLDGMSGDGHLEFSGPDGLFERHVVFDNVVPLSGDGGQHARVVFEAVARSVRDVLSQRWLATEGAYQQRRPKRLFYLSMEFLIGRMLSNNVVNLLLSPLADVFAARHAFSIDDLREEEPDAGLGNGGLGRLAACFLDSLATKELPARGYGLRYEYGMFQQTLVEGWQQEQPDNWLRYPDPWEVKRQGEEVRVQLGCSFQIRNGELIAVGGVGERSELIGLPYDRPVVGYGGKTINTLRLWAASAPDYFDFQRFSSGDFVGALTEMLSAESLTRVLYPDDSTCRGKCLRFIQEYFLVACSLADILRDHRASDSREGGPDWTRLPDRVAIQFNDTHPSLCVIELMRILVDEEKVAWDSAWDITVRTMGYTNHTLLPEALEKWPVAWFARLLPRHLEIIDEVNRRFLRQVRTRFPGDEARVERLSLIEGTEGTHQHKVRMANVAIVGSHSTNGVSAIHTRLLRESTVRDLAEMFPERFNNKTNGVSQRRWLLLANPPLAKVITEAIGDGWITDLDKLALLKPLATDAAFQARVAGAKREMKSRLAAWVKQSTGVVIDPESTFDCQIKRIHEYKRQLLNVIRIVILYNRLRAEPGMQMKPRTFLFAGKAAPAYHLAKVIIKFICNLAGTIDGDPAVRGRIKVVFLPEYSVSMAQRVIASGDVSNQISTAGYEASGTGNMKFMMNGALTVGTRDGATIEMAEQAGPDNLFLFGLTAEQVEGSKGWYDPRWHYDHDPETRAALDLMFSGHFSRFEPAAFDPLREALLTGGDRFMHLADVQSYIEADARMMKLREDPNAWTHQAILNIAASGRFSSDRSISEYASEIWNLKACPVA